MATFPRSTRTSNHYRKLRPWLQDSVSSTWCSLPCGHRASPTEFPRRLPGVDTTEFFFVCVLCSERCVWYVSNRNRFPSDIDVFLPFATKTVKRDSRWKTKLFPFRSCSFPFTLPLRVPRIQSNLLTKNPYFNFKIQTRSNPWSHRAL